MFLESCFVKVEKGSYIWHLFGASPVQPAPSEPRQGRKAAAVGGCSGVMQVACPFFYFPGAITAVVKLGLYSFRN